MEERVVCSVSAAAKYEIPANILLAIREKEGGKPGQWVKNTNGTYDVGELQFNTA
ncbi:conjugal transfer protein TrbN, partial [Salmonella enterica subsp. enterica]|nr:conjugal transfer protein TrbN [Salmonella enterica subsp. enterica]EDP8962563.1 conjugal transfer protein TrbN [Salmonella enterica subsp. enterica]